VVPSPFGADKVLILRELLLPLGAVFRIFSPMTCSLGYVRFYGSSADNQMSTDAFDLKRIRE